ncbi:MAG: hypothetical protein WC376_05405 [Candidatus Nanoarchaeia archaeon]|jgi:hypothetical protein
MSTECNNESIESVFKVIADNYRSFVASPIKNYHEFQRLENFISYIKHHDNKIKSLNELYPNNPSQEIKKNINANKAFKEYYMKRTVVLYSRYFINMTSFD